MKARKYAGRWVSLQHIKTVVLFHETRNFSYESIVDRSAGWFLWLKWHFKDFEYLAMIKGRQSLGPSNIKLTLQLPLYLPLEAIPFISIFSGGTLITTVTTGFQWLNSIGRWECQMDEILTSFSNALKMFAIFIWPTTSNWFSPASIK